MAGHTAVGGHLHFQVVSAAPEAGGRDCPHTPVILRDVSFQVGPSKADRGVRCGLSNLKALLTRQARSEVCADSSGFSLASACDAQMHSHPAPKVLNR